MKKEYILAVIFAFGITISYSQNSYITYDKEKNITQIEDAHIKAYEKIKNTSGYRIQITSHTGSNSSKNAQNSQEEFISKHPEKQAYISYHEPFFVVKVGDYKDELEAAHDLVELKAEYPGAFIIKDKIKYR